MVCFTRDLDSLDFLVKYDIPFIKIPSALLTNLDLIRESAKKCNNLIISGMSTLDEVDQAVR